MKFLLAPNALKGSLSSFRAASIISRSLRECRSTEESVLCPIADGGDGTLDCLVQATGGRIFSAVVHGPLPTMMVEARWGALGDKSTAVIEMAEASGLRLLSPQQYDAVNSSTHGVGELILEAMNAGFKRILVGLGGSATNDGGAGCAKALGAEFLDEDGKELPEGGIHLASLNRIGVNHLDARLKLIEIVSLSDVTNALFGPDGATHTFAPQKGASPDQIMMLERSMIRYASIISRDLGIVVSGIPGSGAAGGLGAGLAAFCGARIESGIEFILDAVKFDDLLRITDCVITAEGMIDGQTGKGKGIDGISRRAEKHGRPVHAFVGRINGDPAKLKKELRLASLTQISPPSIPEVDAMRDAERYLAKSVAEFFSSHNSKPTV